MKTKIRNKVKGLVKYLPFYLFALLPLLAACSKDNTSGMNLSGDCLVEELVLNGQYKATISLEKRQLKVKVPVNFTAADDMTVTSLRLSPGATANVKVGDHLNLKLDKSLTISNGDRVMDYRLYVRNDEAIMTKFVLEGVMGAINQETKTVEVSMLANSGINLASATFEVECSEDAVCNPASGMKGNFTEPFLITLTDNTAVSTYTVTVKVIEKPSAIFVGEAENVEGLNNEEKAAAKWFTGNVPGAAYVSWKDIASANISLDDCKFVFFLRHCAAYGNFENFKTGESGAMAAVPAMKQLWEKGVGFVLGRSAVNYAIALGAAPENAFPNNCWGSGGDGSDLMGDEPWRFSIFDTTHPLWQNLKKFPGAADNSICTLDKNYTICNTTSQFGGIGTWSALKNVADVEALLGGRALIGHSEEVAGWELKSKSGNYGKGGIICIGSGLFDWYSPTAYTSNYHDNLGTIMLNAYDYLTK